MFALHQTPPLAYQRVLIVKQWERRGRCFAARDRAGKNSRKRHHQLSKRRRGTADKIGKETLSMCNYAIAVMPTWARKAAVAAHNVQQKRHRFLSVGFSSFFSLGGGGGVDSRSNQVTPRTVYLFRKIQCAQRYFQIITL